MEQANEISNRLKAYLQNLDGVRTRWGRWLGENEKVALERKSDEIAPVTENGQQLLREIQQVIVDRQQILNDASAAGYKALTLESLADELAIRNDDSLRRGVASAKRLFSGLRRLNVAAWVLVHESACFYKETMSLLVAEQSQQHVYVRSASADTGGGQLLDADL